MNNSNENITIKPIGIAADHGGYELKNYLIKILREQGYDVIDFGDRQLNPLDDYPDYVVPLAKAVAEGKLTRGIAICGSGVGACIAANKIAGVRACLINDVFSAHQGVEDDNMNMICLGGKIVNALFAERLTKIFLEAKFVGAERHIRRLAKITALETI